MFEAEVADDQDDLGEPEPDLGQEPDSEPEPEQTEDNGYSYDVPPLPQPYDEECEPCNGGCSAGSSNAFGALSILVHDCGHCHRTSSISINQTGPEF